MKAMQKGFTLIELMIVVAIIGILAAVAIPAYQDYIKNSNMTRVTANADNATKAVRAEVGKIYLRAGNGAAALACKAATATTPVESFACGASMNAAAATFTTASVIEFVNPDNKLAPGGVPAYTDTPVAADDAVTGAVAVVVRGATIAALEVDFVKPAYKDLTAETFTVVFRDQ